MALSLWAAWARRWTTDDAFINFRVVKQVEAGHGPVFNVGERVEVATSTLWLAILTVVDVVTPVRLEWAAVGSQLVLGAVGLAGGMAGALRLARLRGAGAGGSLSAVVPVGAVAYLAVPVAWDYGTGGLENSLGLAWLGGTFWAVTALVESDTRRPTSRRRLLATAALVGVGVLVRPDFAPYCVGLGLPVGAVAWWRGRAWWLVGGAAAASTLPLTVQAFRMGYYGQLVPNTLHTKESGLPWWDQGWTYLANFARPYALVVPVGATLAWLALAWRSTGTVRVARLAGPHRTRDWRMVVLSVEGAAALHALAVVRVGGDYMHGRLLLPAWCALLLPLFAVRAGELRCRCYAGLALVIGVWALVSATWLRAPAGSLFTGPVDGIVSAHDLAAMGADPIGIVDKRRFALLDSPVRHPVRWDAYESGRAVAAARAAGRPYEPGTYVQGLAGAHPTPPGIDAMVIPGWSLGAGSYAEDLDVWIHDRQGLADPVIARTELLRRGTPGHEKLLGPPWVAAAWVDPEAPIDDPASFDALPPILQAFAGSGPTEELDVDAFAADREAARQALECGKLRELVENARAPLTPRRFLGNVVDAVRLHDVRVPVDPEQARDRFCT
ncbi:MAG TPA: hypothetical protein VFZ79_04380 [Acidimicrobiales bacterium]